MLCATFSVKQRINVGPSGQPEKKAPGSDWHAPRTERSAGFTGALWVQVRMKCSTKQENGLRKATLTLCTWDGPWSLEQGLALERHGPGQFRAREDYCLPVEQGPPSPTLPSTQSLKSAPNTGSGSGSGEG